MLVKIAAVKLWPITLALIVTWPLAPARAQLTFCCRADNDLSKLFPSARRFDVPEDALDRAADGSAVLILADGYPQKRTPVSDALFARAKEKRLHLYVEYPASLPGLKLGETRAAVWERGVITSDAFGGKLPRLRIVAVHGCHWIPFDPSRGDALIEISRVAGYDTAVYDLAKDHAPLLFETSDGNLIAMTKLSHVVTARFAPPDDWRLIWRTILKKLDPAHDPPELPFTPTVRPALSRDEPASAELERITFDRAANFYLHARLLITPRRRDAIHRLLRAGTETVDPPVTDEDGDGTLGMMEGYASAVRSDGSQPQRTPIRSDCNAEAAMVLALSGEARGKTVAANLLDYVFGPEMESMGRSDPAHPAFGLIAWGAMSPAWMIANYGDDDARVILSAILASAALKTDRWDVNIARALLANLRTTGTLGFRGDRIDIGPLEQHGWKHYHDAATVNPAPHFESYLWACYLWAYARTGEREFLDKTTTAIRMTMDVYAKGQWRWMDNIERSRMLLCLAWLCRVQGTPEHRAWLSTIATDLLAAQQPCGAIQERLGGAGGGHYRIPQSNEEYGTAETPLIQKVGDPACDQLYTTGFALLALHEAAAAVADPKLKAAEDKLAEFLCRIQVRSDAIPYLDGGWFRAFDYQRWDYWASNADLGWGVWSVEAGWGQAWIAATLSLRDRHTTFWEMTNGSKVKDQLDRARAELAHNAGGPWVTTR
jgi:hypothetical protein